MIEKDFVGNRDISAIPLVTTEVATLFHEEHGQNVSDTDFIDETLREMTRHNRPFVDELDRIASVIMEEKGIDAKLDFIRANAIGYALLSRQVSVDSLEATFRD